MSTVKSTGGSCLCGAVTFSVTGDLRAVSYCHCSQCRKTHGHFAAYTNADRRCLEMHREDGLTWYASSDIAQRGFCHKCGASLFWQRKDSATISIAAGCLDGATGLVADRHIFVSDAGDYYHLNDDLPSYSQGG